jgi:hypothetical protein
MRIIYLILLLIMLFLLFTSCKDEPTAPINSDRLIGAWVFLGYESDVPSDGGQVTILQRSGRLDSSNYGYIFYNEGKLLERKNAGWCGTPPISYANFSGTWEFQSDSLIKINVAYWGGMTDYALKIISLNRAELKVKYLYPL